MLSKTKYTLLYIEDDPFVREMVIEYLEDFFIKIYEASNGEEALTIYFDKKPDIIITDIEMPKMNGLELTTKIRESDENTPIIITTAYTSTEYLLQAVELNLVKYLIKPISENSLHEGLELCFDSLENQLNSNIVKLTAEHRYDVLNQTLIYRNEIIPLTKSQNRILTLLIKHKNRVVSYVELENYIWADKGMSEAALRSMVRDIRTIISKRIIKNISRVGYKINLYSSEEI